MKDVRSTLPRHATRQYRKREVSKILGICAHHMAGGDNMMTMARWHVSQGNPGAAYTFGIDFKGEIWWLNDLDAQTWSQGGRSVPDINRDGVVDREDGDGAANARYLAVVFGGSFQSRYNDSGQEPTPAQIAAFIDLCGVLFGDPIMLERAGDRFPEELHGALGHLSWGGLVTHSDFGKAACPGDSLTYLIDVLNAAAGTQAQYRARAWQEGLRRRGYYLGTLDGIFGDGSIDALRRFQRDNDLPVTGYRDGMSAARLGL